MTANTYPEEGTPQVWFQVDLSIDGIDGVYRTDGDDWAPLGDAAELRLDASAPTNAPVVVLVRSDEVDPSICGARVTLMRDGRTLARAEGGDLVSPPITIRAERDEYQLIVEYAGQRRQVRLGLGLVGTPGQQGIEIEFKFKTPTGTPIPSCEPWSSSTDMVATA